MNPFHNVFRLSLGDFVAKVVSFCVFVHLARVLGIESFGVLTFALSIMAYLLLFCDAGLELWGTREVARGKPVDELAGRIIALRTLFSGIVLSVSCLALLLPVFPSFPHLRLLLALFGLVLLTQIVDLRWVFMGQQKMRLVATGLVISQVVFAAATFVAVKDPSDVVWVPVFQFLGNLAMSVYFLSRYIADGHKVRLQLRGSGRSVLSPALTLGVSRALALLSFNFDTILLGFLVGSAAVGLYGAAYRPIAAMLATSATYFLGLFPVLSKAHHEGSRTFLSIIETSLRLTTALAIGFGVAGTFLARPIIELLYGGPYNDSIPVLQILAWSASLVLIRGTFRQALCAAGYHKRDLRIAAIASGTNVALNLVLIPSYAMMGAASATVASEVLWVSLIVRASRTFIGDTAFLAALLGPVVGGLAMTACFICTDSWPWQLQAVISGGVYLATVVTIGQLRGLGRPILEDE